MTRAIVLVLALGLAGCHGWLPAAVAGFSWLGQVLDVAQAGSRAWLARHPSHEAEDQVDEAILRARSASAALGAALAAGDRGDAAKARVEAVAAYRDLRALLDRLGILEGRPAIGGAETEAPRPGRLDLPTAEQLGAYL